MCVCLRVCRDRDGARLLLDGTELDILQRDRTFVTQTIWMKLLAWV